MTATADDIGNEVSAVTRTRAADRDTLTPGHPLFGLGYAEPVSLRPYVRLANGLAEISQTRVAEETPVALVYNGRPHAVMMCTPADIKDFARGFTITEAIVAGAAEILRITPVRYSQGIEVAVEVPAGRADSLRERGRSLVGRTGCGLCGVTTIEDALRPGRELEPAAPISAAALYRAAAELPDRQRYNDGTGAVHAAAFADRAGHLVLAREDVGRHNALDKLIGAMLAAGIDPRSGFAVVTSRASYELVQKCAVAGIPALAAVSRPTNLAIRMAEAAGIGLAGLVRGASANVYGRREAFVP